jgi:organic hydroperoxide reductase OsmC/OhrA
LFLAAKNGVRVVGYTDDAEGRLGVIEKKLRLSHVVLRPHVTLEAGADEALARGLVARAHSGCFIANSVSTTIDIEPTFDTVSAEVTLS